MTTIPDASALRDLLRRFRDLHAKNDPGIQSHHHPIWAEVADALSQGEA